MFGKFPGLIPVKWQRRSRLVITCQDLSEVAGARASQEAEPVDVGQGQGGIRPGAHIGDQQ